MIEIQKALTALLELLSHPAPGFICVAAGEAAGPRYLARVRHFAKPPASDGDLRWILNRLRPLGKPYAALYALHDGARLFAPTISRLSGTDSRDGGFEYFPISDVRARSDERIASLLPGTTPSSELLAFAQIPLSANLICIGCTGEEKGKLIELNHDAPPGGFGIPQELAELLAFVSVDSAYLLRACGCYTRYSDGKSEKQWIPIRYVADANAIHAREVAAEPLPDWWD